MTTTFGDILDETLPLVGFIPVAGPPAILLAGPWLLLVLLLVGCFALLITVAALLMVAAALVALIRELVRAPYRLLRDLRGHRPAHLSLPVPVARGGVA